MTAEQEQTWGELGPAMRALNARQQAFVRAFILEKPGYGAITPFLAGRAFEPEALKNMSTAFESVCEHLGLVIRHDPATEAIARYIVDLAQTGVQDFESLVAATMKNLEPEDDQRGVIAILTGVARPLARCGNPV